MKEAIQKLILDKISGLRSRLEEERDYVELTKLQAQIKALRELSNEVSELK
jgi:hypothetical protein